MPGEDKRKLREYEKKLSKRKENEIITIFFVMYSIKDK